MSSPRNISFDKITTSQFQAGSGPVRTWRIYRHLKQKTHTVTPNFRYLRAQGMLLPDLAYYHRDIKETYGVYNIASSLADFNKGKYSDVYSYYQNASFGISLTAPNSSDTRAKAYEKFFQNAKAHQSNIGVTVAELPKTIALIGDTAARLAEFYRRLRRFDIRGAFGAIGLNSPKHQRSLERRSRGHSRKPAGRDEFAAKTALEVNYGWMPLLGEIDSAMEDLAYRLATKPDQIFIRGGATAEGSYTFNQNFGNGSTHGAYGARRRLVGPVINTVRYGVVCRASIIDAASRTRAGMGVTNPFEIAWELIPFSFVVDWFAPIGAWIDSLDSLNGLSFVDGSESYLKKVQWTEDLNGLNTQSYTTIFGGQTRSYKEIEFRRTKLLGFPSTFNMLHLEGIKEALGTTRAINAISLLTLAVRRNKVSDMDL